MNPKVYIVLWDVQYEGTSIVRVFTNKAVATQHAQQMNMDHHGTPEGNSEGNFEGAFVETWETN